MPDRVKIRQILLKTQGKPPAEEPQIKAKAEDLLKQIKAGAGLRRVLLHVLMLLLAPLRG